MGVLGWDTDGSARHLSFHLLAERRRCKWSQETGKYIPVGVLSCVVTLVKGDLHESSKVKGLPRVFSNTLGLALGSRIFPSSCEGKLGVALGSLQGRRDLMQDL